MKSDKPEPSANGQAETVYNPFAATHPEPSPTCCGRAMAPRLAQARDGMEPSFFITVWRCAVCGRLAT